MIRIGMVGSDNSHAYAFAKLCNVDQAYGDAARVTMLCGADPARNREVTEKAAIPTIVESAEAMLGQVDAVMVLPRHGDLHLAAAMPFLEAGLPVFVEKPFAISLSDCERMIETANRSGALLTSYSTVRFNPDVASLEQEAAALGGLRMGTVTGPCDFNSQYGGPFFYANHALEVALRLFGESVTTVTTDSSSGNVTATLHFGGGELVTLNYVGNGHKFFHALVIGKDGWAARSLASAGGYPEGVRLFLEMIQTGKRPLTDEQLINPIRIIHAIARSVSLGGSPVDVATVK